MSVVGVVAAPVIKVAPAALAFSYQLGTDTLPAAQALTVSPLSGSAALLIGVRAGTSPWLSVTPLTGRTPLAVRVAVNPSTLPIGVYYDTISLTTPENPGDELTIAVTLTVRGPPADIRLSASTLSVTYKFGDPPPANLTEFITTTGGLLSFTTAVSGTKWLRVTPPSAAVFPGFRTPLTLSIDTSELSPGSYTGTVNVASPDAVTKTTKLAVNLTIQPGQPVTSGIWPLKVTRGSPDLTVTVNGNRFFSGTIVRAGPTLLKSNVLGPNVLQATIPASLLANPGNVILTVSNPDPGGGAASPIGIQVLPPGPIIGAVVNSASQLAGAFAPATVITIYGTGLGPDTLAAFDGATPQVPTLLSGTRVLLNASPLPIIYTSARQVSVALPSVMDTGFSYALRVEYNGVVSDPLTLTGAAGSPAVFTLNGTGTGPAALFQYDLVKGEISLNNDKTPAVEGNILIFYTTGLGPPLPISPDGQVPTTASTASIPNVTVMIGDTPAEVIYAGAAPGLIAGIVQVNARLPDAAPSGKAVPLTVRLGQASSPPGVTLNIK